MCGIAGYIGKKPLSTPRIDHTLDLMRNRGPDFSGYQYYKDGDAYIYLLHSRLSIVDLEPRSHQPYHCGQCTLIFNGEIYNYLEIRRELIKRNYQFETTSDTEVLIKAYLEFGSACVDWFEGMWAFAIYDRRKKVVLLSRDRFSEKPLYWARHEDGIYFGSETKFLRQLDSRQNPIDEHHLLRYLILGYRALHKGNDTFYSGIKAVQSSTNILIDMELKCREEKYWSPVVPINEPILDLQEAIDGARECLIDSLRMRLRSDVPIAFCLSGGVDSAALVSIAAKELNVDTYTYSIIDNDPRYNEKDNIDATIQNTGCSNVALTLTPGNVLERIGQLVKYHDAPVATISYFVHSMLIEQMAKAGFRIAISGTSADELFTGYYDHFLLHLYEVKEAESFDMHKKNWEQYIRPMVRNDVLRDACLYIKNPEYRDHVYDNNAEFRKAVKVPFDEQFHETPFVDNLMRNRMLNELFCEATPLILHEDDLNSMYYSMENRSPYLDRRLYEFLWRVPRSQLIQEGYGKYILRQAMRGIVADPVLNDRRKKGFNASIESLVDFDDPVVREWMFDENSEIYNLIDRKFVMSLVEGSRTLNHYSKFLFSFISAKLFLSGGIVA